MNINQINAVVSWSGGKDSCFACYKAMLDGITVSYIYNSVSEEYNRVSFHGIKADLVYAQAQAIEIPLIQKKVTKNNYEEIFKEGMSDLKKKGMNAIVFGDVELQEHRDWIEKICEATGLRPILPLWGKDSQELLTDFIETGFVATIVSTNSELIGKKWVGRKINKSFIGDFLNAKFDKRPHILGENGEYHTVVTDGPIFKKRIKITDVEKVLIDGYWFLDIKKYEVG